jgi:hypothetical protein
VCVPGTINGPGTTLAQLGLDLITLAHCRSRYFARHLLNHLDLPRKALLFGFDKILP